MDTGAVVIKDIHGNGHEIYPYRFISRVIMASLEPEGVPIGCIAKDYKGDITLGWVDNDFVVKTMMDKIEDFIHSGKDIVVSDIVDKYDDIVSIEIRKENAEFMAITLANTVIPIMSAMITPLGEIKGYWIDKDFRGSTVLRKYIAILLKDTLEKGIMVSKGIDKLRTRVHNGNMPAIKARAKFGFNTYGRLNERGIDYLYSGQSVKECIEHTKELIGVGV
jgi:hypothetical protein